MGRPGQTFKDPLSLILACLVVLALSGAWLYAKQAAGIDYYVTWVAADAIETDKAQNIYEQSARNKLAAQYRNKAVALPDTSKQKQVAAFWKELQITATPFLYWVTSFTVSGDYEKDLKYWLLLTLILVSGSILVLCRLLAYTPAASLAVLLPVLVWFMPFYSNMNVANVNAVQLGLVALVLLLASRGSDTAMLFATGIVIGLTVMFKPNLAPVALLFGGGWAVRQQYQRLVVSLGGMAAGAFIAVLVSSIWMGSVTVWLDWFNYIREFVDGGPGPKGGNYSIITQLASDISPAGQLAAAIFLCLLVLACLWWGRRRLPASIDTEAARSREFIENASLVAVGCIIPMLTSTLVWLHYYLLIMPMIIVALRPWNQTGPMKVIPLIMLRVLPVMALVLLLDTALRELTGMEVRAYRSMATTASAVSLFLVALWQLGFGIRETRLD